jgi:hypothetical protein
VDERSDRLSEVGRGSESAGGVFTTTTTASVTATASPPERFKIDQFQ